jgi:hypothetical protein
MGFFEGSKYTMDEVKAVMINEGLDYAIDSWMTLENIEDDELRELCMQFKEVRQKIKDRMESVLGEGACSGL